MFYVEVMKEKVVVFHKIVFTIYKIHTTLLDIVIYIFVVYIQTTGVLSLNNWNRIVWMMGVNVSIENAV